MKKILLCTLLFWLAAFTSQAQINNLAPVWADVFSGSGTATGNKVAIGANGNVYTIGTFTGTVDFDPSAGVDNRTSLGGTDVFVVATNSAGGFLWVQVVANSGGNDIGTGIAVSPTNGDIYVCGWLILNSFDIFVTRLSATNNGAVLNTRTIGAGNSDLAQSLCVDSQGSVIVVGAFENTVDFGGAAGVLTCSSGLLADTFILKLDATLVTTWVNGYGGNQEDSTYGVVTDANNNIYFTSGFRSASIVFGTTTLNNRDNGNGNLDIAVVGLTATGNVNWATSAGGTGNDRGLSITLGANNILYCTGEFSGIAAFGVGVRRVFRGSNGLLDVFISSINTNGTFNWTRTFGGTGDDIGRRVVVDNASNVHAVGNFVGTVDFDPNAGIQNLGGNTNADNGFISRLDVNGNFLSANQISSNGSATANGVALDATNRIHVTGDFINTVRLNPSNISLNNVTSNTRTAYTAVYVPFVCAITINTASLPSNIVGTAYNQTLTQTGLIGAPIWTITTGALPAGLTLNATTGVISGTTNVLGASTFTVSIGVATCTQTKTYTIVVTCPAVVITPASLPNSIPGSAYNQTLTQTGLTGAQTWTITSGALPAGLTLDATTGIISGTTNVLGTSTFTVSIGSGACLQTKIYTIVVSCPTITIFPETVVVPPPGDGDGTKANVSSITITSTSTTLPDGTAGITYTQIFTQTGLPSAVWAVSAGTLPAGLTLNASTGVLSGIPTQAGSFCFTVQVSNSFCSQTKRYCITINCGEIVISVTQPDIIQPPLGSEPIITPPAIANGVIGAYYAQVFIQTGLTSANWTIVGGSIPTGLTLNATGTLSGTPTQIGTFCFTVQASDQNCSQAKGYCIVIACPTIVINPTILPNGSVCLPYTQQISQTGLYGNAIWSITSGALPSGLTLDPNTGLLNGTPTSVGTFNFITAVTDSTCSGTRNHTIVISCAPATPASIVLTFPEMEKVYCVEKEILLNVTSSNPQAGTTITYVSSDTSIAVVNGNVVTIVGTGGFCITALQVNSDGTGVLAQKCFEAVNCKQQQPKNLILDSPKNEVNLYPNPTDGVFEVEFTKSMGTLNVEVANVAGVVVLKETFTKKNILENANETIKLDISTLPAGLYLVKWNDGTTSGTKRVVKR